MHFLDASQHCSSLKCRWLSGLGALLLRFTCNIHPDANTQIVILDEGHNVEDNARQASSLTASHTEFRETVCDLQTFEDDEELRNDVMPLLRSSF